MNHILRTSRLDLRPCAEADVSLLLEHWGEARVRRFLFDDEVAERATIEGFVARSSATFRERGYGLWLLTGVESSEFRGVCGLWESETVGLDLLFSIVPEHWGRGLATESASRVLHYAFDDLGLQMIAATVDKPNVKSIKTLERLGMNLREERVINSKPVLCYAVTCDEHRASREVISHR